MYETISRAKADNRPDILLLLQRIAALFERERQRAKSEVHQLAATTLVPGPMTESRP
jgi:hypothetical protein